VANELRNIDADIVLFQEVDRGTRRSGRVDQVATLAQLAHYSHHHFFHAIEWDEVGSYGLAMISRHPLSDLRTVQLPIERSTEPRVLGTALVHTPHGAVRTGVTHLSHRPFERSLRIRQIARIHEALEGGPEPLLLGGDFNDLPNSEPHRAVTSRYRDLFDAAGEGDAGTHPFAPGITLRIDYVFGCQRVRPHRTRVHNTTASDHHALVTDISFANEARVAS
jgi:endonuclease/exonuclease/phosphatase family metal-dependent hydrolase